MSVFEEPVVLILERDRELGELFDEIMDDLFEANPENRPNCLLSAFPETALTIFRMWRTQLIAVFVDDFHLPEDEVLSFIRHVKMDGAFAGNLIALTGNPIACAKMVDAGCERVLAKPFLSQDFLECLQSKDRWKVQKLRF